ncbi:MAG TPA: hypothetical protein VMN38_10345 [Sphingomicrobium sp.]|nr:hypothetical protein [Sphingomicrobium sp.]
MADNPPESMVVLSAYAIGHGAGIVLPQLCRRLALSGVLAGPEIETLRHFALQGFDELRERKDLSKEEIEALEKARGHLDALWHRAAIAAEGQGSQKH